MRLAAFPDLPIFQRAAGFSHTIDHPAIISDGKSYSYAQLLADASSFRDVLLKSAANGAKDLADQRVAFLCPNKYEYAVAQWAVWAAGGVVVPISTHQPPSEIEYTVANAEASVSVVHKTFKGKFAPVAENMKDLKLVEMEDYEPRKVAADQVSLLESLLYDHLWTSMSSSRQHSTHSTNLGPLSSFTPPEQPPNPKASYTHTAASTQTSHPSSKPGAGPPRTPSSTPFP